MNTNAHAAIALGMLLGLAFCASVPAAEPSPVFRVPFDGDLLPAVSRGADTHPDLPAEGVEFREGRDGQAVLLGDCAPLVYQAGGNIPDEATVTLWVKPLDWQPIDAWRYLLVISPRGRQIMYLANYPRKPPVMQFLWTGTLNPAHETTSAALTVNEWNHVAVAWDGVRSRVYFNGKLVLSKPHPSGFRPTIPARATLQLGGMRADVSSRCSYASPPWGKADTLVDDLSVYEGMLSGEQIAALAGTTAERRPFAGPPPNPPFLAVPRRTVPPELNGRVEPDEWADAAALPLLIDCEQPGMSFDQPEFSCAFAYDDRQLYVKLRSVFPLGVQIPKGGTRTDLNAPDEQVWDDESFELWMVVPGEERTFRFAGNAAGGFTESLGKDTAWTGKWTYATTMGMNIYGNEYWDVEVAIPFDTLGIEAPDNTEIRMNICRTWRCLDRLKLTTWAGWRGYPDTQYFGTMRLAPDAPAYRFDVSGTPSAGHFTHTMTCRNPTPAPLTFTVQASLLASDPAADRQIVSSELDLAPKEEAQVDITAQVDDAIFERVAYTMIAADGKPLLDYSVPFKLRSDFLDVIPVLSRDEVVARPSFALYTSQLARKDIDDPEVVLRLLGPTGKPLAKQPIDSGDDVVLTLPDDAPPGEYRVLMGARTENGTLIEPCERRFERPPKPPWLTQDDDALESVLPPFTPLETATTPADGLSVACWGRNYVFGNRMLPSKILSGNAGNLLADPIVLLADGKPIEGTELQSVSSTPVRNQWTVAAQDERVAITGEVWMEYDGVIFYTIEVEARAPCEDLVLSIPMTPDMAQYAHLASGGFGAGGGSTVALDTPLRTSFYPVVWVGNFERGLAWFCEGGAHLPAKRAKDLIAVDPGQNRTAVRVRLADRIAKGDAVTVRFGLQATPVKPQHPRYPLNVFARDALWDQPPRIPAYASVWWKPQNFFLDIPSYDASRATVVRPAALLREVLAGTETKYIPYMTPYTLSSEYPEARSYRREWEIVPARHSPGQTRQTNRDETREWTELWMSPASETYRRYYAWKLGQTIRDTGMRGVYFDFACAFPDSNTFHGAHGGFPILGMRDFYRRVVNEFVKAGVDDYVIVAHNSQSVQIPALTYVTHFYNGEHLRTSSSPTLHEGRDYLDTQPLYWFGIEQSGLPWGMHPNMLVEFDEAKQLIERLGVHDESVTEYLWKRTPSVVMPILLHGSLPDGYRLSLPYFKSVVATLNQFDIPSATFRPYWRKQDWLTVDNDAFKVSAYTRPEAPRALLVVGNLGDQDSEVTLHVDLDKIYDWKAFDLPGMKRVEKPGDLMQVVEHVGARDARIVDIGPRHVRLWVRRHGMALVEAAGHIRVR